MQSTRASLLLIVAIVALGLSGCGGGVSDARKAEMLRDLRSRTTAYKPVVGEDEFSGPAPQISEPFIRVWSVQETVADALGRIGGDAVPALVKALSHPNAEVRVQATHALALIGSRAKPAVPELSRLLGDDNQEVRRGAARALGQIGPAAGSAVPALLHLLELPPSSSSPAADGASPPADGAPPAAGHASPDAS
ncbi:MAG TPA: HEAT repeat domain-containing protein [Pirellulales bacterium]